MRAFRTSHSISASLVKDADVVYAAAVFATAAAVLWIPVSTQGFLTADHGYGTAAFFLLFGLFTITMGYPHPHFGHVSFDRVAQVAAILVLGPVDAAVINAVASLLYPWQRLRDGETLRAVVTASLLNSGMMAIVVLAGGSLYTAFGGPVPLSGLSPGTAGSLLVLMLGMQLVNDLCMLGLLLIRKLDPRKFITLISTAVELVSMLTGVIVALVFVRLDLPAFLLLLGVLSLGMFVFKRFAEMRLKLEALVAERTNELRLKTVELERQATRDKLTGLFNRRYADDFLQREIEESLRHDRPFAIALADIDYFKQVNDRYSHAVGDEVLRRVADVLVDRCRKTDVVARYGGEEFLLCFPNTTGQAAEAVCGQIRSAIEQADWTDVFEKAAVARPASVGLTISFGVAEVGVDSRRKTLLSVADTRLYQAKHKGRNRVVA